VRRRNHESPTRERFLGFETLREVARDRAVSPSRPGEMAGSRKLKLATSGSSGSPFSLAFAEILFAVEGH